MSTEAVERGWQLELTSAEAYERYLVPAVARAWAGELVALAGPQADERTLDVGCGTGIVARTVAEQARPRAPVVGLDVNPAMLRVAREAGAGLPVEWVEGSALALPFPDGSFDVALSQAALMFVGEPPLALAELRRVLRPGGRVAISVPRSLAHQPAYARLADALERHASAEAAGVTRSIFSLGDVAAVRALLVDAGFRDVAVRISVTAIRYPSFAELVRREAAISPLAEELRRLPERALAAVAAELAEAMPGYEDDLGVALPIETLAACGRA